MTASALPQTNLGQSVPVGHPRLGTKGLQSQADSPGFDGRRFIQGDRLVVPESAGKDMGGAPSNSA